MPDSDGTERWMKVDRLYLPKMVLQPIDYQNMFLPKQCMPFLILVSCLCSCGDSTRDKLVGEWSGVIEHKYGKDDMISMVFKEDGTYLIIAGNVVLGKDEDIWRLNQKADPMTLDILLKGKEGSVDADTVLFHGIVRFITDDKVQVLLVAGSQERPKQFRDPNDERAGLQVILTRKPK